MINGDRPTRVALLIDADNLSGDVIEQAIEHLLKNHGAIHFRRAYCSPQKVIEHLELFRRHSIRPMVNVPTGKNSTDIALAVDAIDLALTERPDVVVIASSDSDYAPLAQRLREKGCRVLGIGQAGKTGAESPVAYDGFTDLAHRSKPRGSAGGTRASAPDAPVASRTTKAPSRGVNKGSAKSAARGGLPSTPDAPVDARTEAAAELLPAAVLSILQAAPGLRSGQTLQLNEIGEALRKHDLIKGKSASPSRFLKRHADYFELMPADKPRSVRFMGTPSR